MSEARILVSCPEGWTYSSWQRVTVEITLRILDEETGGEVCNIHRSITGLVAEILDTLSEREGEFHYDEYNLFVMSGESATLEDFAETIRDIFKFPVDTEDGANEIVREK